MQKAEMNRRRFLGIARSAIAVPYVITSSALGGNGRVPASDRIVMGTIGCGGQGIGDLQGFLGFRQVQMVAVCDPVTSHREHARQIVCDHYHNKDCKDYKGPIPKCGHATLRLAL